VRNIQPALTVNIAEFAALLGDRQVVIVVHERALFDHLTLELSPVFPGTA
jgi:exonuclease SbcC